MTTDSQLLGIAGVHLACAELTIRGYIATLTSRNAECIDILVSNRDGSKTKTIQVKTTRKNKDWLLNKKAENIFSDNFLYIFVNINKGNKAEFHIVPSNIISNMTKKDHQEWLKTPNKKGQPHNDNPMRHFVDKEDEYLNRWEFLGLN